jgi:hypothetical protein
MLTSRGGGGGGGKRRREEGTRRKGGRGMITTQTGAQNTVPVFVG